MTIDGLIILDHTGRPIIQSNFASSPAYPLLHIDAVNDALAKSPAGAVDPVLYVSGPSGPSACCHVACNGLRFLCPVSGEVDPLFVFAFIQTFVDILRDYFGDLSAASIRENFDIVYQLLEEVIDDGYPLTTELNALRDIVLPPTFLKKVISVAGITGLSKATGHPFSSPIPWRKAGLRYNNNEIKFDVIEDLDAIVNKNGSVVTSTVWGKVQARSHLSGVPDLLMTFTNPQVLTDCSFHPCVRLQRWTRDKSLSFVPPDGAFVLMEYRYTPPNAALTASSQANIPLPIALKSSVTLTEGGGTLDLTLTSRMGIAMQSATVELFLGSGAQSANFMVSGGGSWNFDPKTLILRWTISPVPSSSSHTLRGSFTSSETVPRIGSALKATYEIQPHSYSGLKVDQLKVSGEQYKTYKGVRLRAGGSIEFRW
ncbi:clathrin adaptor, mu subunit [Exidia glandulosa HHB12029]|uniref:Clathrin adaptor, mu subunit n=1 Tax=Exidia glandulosa HHB12029 TaxID=1314781 RepID=A0A165QPG9_EXIGL|nr:clathrin adaptor, mu subunit [Exidia glandulosa HHB12029]